MAVLPYLFNNSECWLEIPKKAIKLLDSLQSFFFISLFETSKGCPKPAYFWDTGSLLTTNIIMKKKLLFFHHLVQLPENSLAEEIFTIQKENAIPGLVYECNE